MHVNIDAAKVPSTARTASGLMVDSQPIATSALWSSGTAASAATMLNKGGIQIEFLR
jgi:hypothetical protein